MSLNLFVKATVKTQTNSSSLLSLPEPSMHPPGFSQADAALFYPAPVSPDPVSPLTHLGTLLNGHDAQGTGGWDR